MNTYRKIKELWGPEDIARFITTIIQETEDRMLYKLAEYGIEASIARLAFELRVFENLHMLMEEVDDGNT